MKFLFSVSHSLHSFHFTLQIRAEAAYLYDAVHLYADALIKVIKEGGNPKNGTAIIDAVKGRKYKSAMGYELCLFQMLLNRFFMFKKNPFSAVTWCISMKMVTLPATIPF